MKKIILIAILFTFLFSFNSIYAEDKSFDPNSTTIAKLQETALNNSRQALIDDVDIKGKEMAIRTVRSDANAMSDSILSVTKPMGVQLDLDVAKKAKQDHLNQLSVDVYKTALNIQLCNKEIELKQYKLAVAEDKFGMVKARFKASVITQDTLDSAQYDIDSSNVDLSNSKEKLNSLFLELKKLLNQPLYATAVTITDKLNLAIIKEVELNSALENLYKTETTVYSAENKLNIAQTAMDIAAKLYVKGNLSYDNSVIDLDEAKLNYEAAKAALDVKVKNKYNDVLNSKDDVELACKYAELAKKKLVNAQTKYNKGTITKEAYLDAQVAQREAEYTKLSTIVSFNEVNAEFENIVGQK